MERLVIDNVKTSYPEYSDNWKEVGNFTNFMNIHIGVYMILF